MAVYVNLQYAQKKTAMRLVQTIYPSLSSVKVLQEFEKNCIRFCITAIRGYLQTFFSDRRERNS